MTTNKNLLKPEHGTIQAQDVHEIKKESEADSTKKQTSFPPSLIDVQTIRTVIEFTLVLPLLPWLSNPLVLILFLPFGLHFILQAVAWSRAEKETRIASVTVTNIYSLVVVSPSCYFLYRDIYKIGIYIYIRFSGSAMDMVMGYRCSCF